MSTNKAKKLLDPEFLKECTKRAEQLAGKRPFGTLIARRTKQGIEIKDSEFDKYTNE